MSKKTRSRERSPRKEAAEGKQIDNSPYVFQRDKINFDLRVRELPWTEKQKDIIELITNKATKIVFLNGPAGCSKSLLAVYSALKQLNDKKITEIVYVRSIIESATKSLGSLPGESSDKFKPFALPLADKMEELLSDHDIKRLFIDERIKPTPINYLRGASFNVNFVIADEMQNAVYSEIQTVMTRIGQFSKLIMCGDPAQSDLPAGKSGFLEVYNAFNNEESQSKGIFCVELTEEDIMRSDICRYIVGKFGELRRLYLQQKESNMVNSCKKTSNHSLSSMPPSWSPQRD